MKHYLVHLNSLPKPLGTGAIYFSCSAQKKTKQRILILEIMHVPANTAEKPRASLLVSVLLKHVARKKSQHTVCQIERIKITWESKFAEGTSKRELQNTTWFWKHDEYLLAFWTPLKPKAFKPDDKQKEHQFRYRVRAGDELGRDLQLGSLISSLVFSFS